MSGFAKKIEANFGARKSRVIRVPEWDNLEIHVFPLTMGQISRIDEESDDMKRVIRKLIVRARKEDGTPIFDAEDAEALLAQGVGPYGPDVVTRVVLEIQKEDRLDEAAVEKN